MHGVIDPAHSSFDVTENVIDRASVHGYPLKLWFGLISMPAHSPNF